MHCKKHSPANPRRTLKPLYLPSNSLPLAQFPNQSVLISLVLQQVSPPKHTFAAQVEVAPPHCSNRPWLLRAGLRIRHGPQVNGVRCMRLVALLVRVRGGHRQRVPIPRECQRRHGRGVCGYLYKAMCWCDVTERCRIALMWLITVASRTVHNMHLARLCFML